MAVSPKDVYGSKENFLIVVHRLEIVIDGILKSRARFGQDIKIEEKFFGISPLTREDVMEDTNESETLAYEHILGCKDCGLVLSFSGEGLVVGIHVTRQLCSIGNELWDKK